MKIPTQHTRLLNTRSRSYESTKVQQTGMYAGTKSEDTKEWLRELQRRYIFHSGKTQRERTVWSVLY